MEIKPSAGEISNLWKFIIGNQAQLCLLEHWRACSEDADLSKLLEVLIEEASRISSQGVTLYKKAGFPEPIGFNLETDLFPDAPKLMSDRLVLFILQVLSEYGVYGYGLTLGKTDTPEVLTFIRSCLDNAADLYQQITELIKIKGFQHQPIFVPPPKEAQMVQHHSFLAGWLGEQRPISAVEIDNILYSLRGVILAKTMFMAFSQVAKDKKIQKYCNRGKDLTGKRVERLQTIQASENLPFQATYETEVTDSTISPFSDRLILFEAISLAQIAVARYGNALSTMIRRDLSSIFAAYIAETGTFLDDGVNLMIDFNWFEQPPLAADRNHKNKQNE